MFPKAEASASWCVYWKTAAASLLLRRIGRRTACRISTVSRRCGITGVRIVGFIYAIGVLAMSLLAVTTVAPRAYSRMSAEQSISALAARVRELEDEQQIERVIMLYGSTLDARDFHTYAGL